MGAPVIPSRTYQESLTDILESIALEEAALATFLNAEGEKIQAVAKQSGINPAQLVQFQESVTHVMQTGIKWQMLLQFKLEEVARLAAQSPPSGSGSSSGSSGGGAGGSSGSPGTGTAGIVGTPFLR